MYINSMFRELFVGIYIFSSMGGLAVLFVPQDSVLSDVGSTPIFMISWAMLYALTIVMMLHWRPRFSGIFFIVLLPSLYFILSSIWSVQPMKTLIYSVAFMMNMIFVIFVYANYDESDFLRILLRILLLMVGLSVGLGLLGVESVAYLDVHGRENILGGEPQRGLFNHKITAGIYSSMGFLLAMNLYCGVKRVVACSIFFTFVLMTGSATALAILIISISILIFVRFVVSRNVSANMFVLSLFFTVLVIVVLAMHYMQDVLYYLGRDPTLTGRTLLWSWALDIILDKPIFGWGYLSYNGSVTAALMADTYTEFQNYSVPHFHNSYLQVMVEGGVALLVLFLGFVFISIRSYYLRYQENKLIVSLTYLVIILTLLIEAVFVNLMFKYNDFNSMLLLVVIMYSLSYYRGGSKIEKY